MEQYNVTVEFIKTQLSAIDVPWNTVYGIPRGGLCAAAFLSQAKVTDNISLANIILDDIVDSGATRDRYMAMPEVQGGAVFCAIIEKTDPNQWVVFPWEAELDETTPTDAVVRLLQHIGEDPKRDGLLETPKRVTKALTQLTRGYGQDPADILSKRFQESSDQLIVVKDVPFHSLCEHHMLPFTGTVSIGYLPDKEVVGLSKLPRLVHCFARRLQIQERMTNQIAEAMLKHLKPKFVGVIVNAHHTCMSMRGIESSGHMITSAMLGEFRDDLKHEFLGFAKP